MKSSSSVGPRGVARSEFWLSPTGMPWLVVSCGCLPRVFWCNWSPVPRASGALAERSTATADAGLPEDLAMGTPRWRAEMLAIHSSLERMAVNWMCQHAKRMLACQCARCARSPKRVQAHILQCRCSCQTRAMRQFRQRPAQRAYGVRAGPAAACAWVLGTHGPARQDSARPIASRMRLRWRAHARRFPIPGWRSLRRCEWPRPMPPRRAPMACSTGRSSRARPPSGEYAITVTACSVHASRTRSMKHHS